MGRGKIILLLFCVGVLIQLGVGFILKEKTVSNVPEIEIKTPEIVMNNGIDTSSFNGRSGQEWMPVPVVSCELNNTKRHRSKYLVTLENGLVMGSDKKIEVGARDFCWMNMWYRPREIEYLDSLVFVDPYIDKKIN